MIYIPPRVTRQSGRSGGSYGGSIAGAVRVDKTQAVDRL